jgi:hypothetical protein
MTMDRTYLIRCTTRELNIWKKQAWEERLSLSMWTRRRLHGVQPIPEDQRRRGSLSSGYAKHPWIEIEVNDRGH